MSEESANGTERASRITLIALIAGVILVVIIALIAVFGRGTPELLDDTTPEGVVQRYAQAVADGDFDTAKGFLPPGRLDPCRSVSPAEGDLRVTLVESMVTGGRARVDVLIVTTYGTGPLGGNEYESEGRFTLLETADGWLIDEAPWEFTICERSDQRQ